MLILDLEFGDGFYRLFEIHTLFVAWDDRFCSHLLRDLQLQLLNLLFELLILLSQFFTMCPHFFEVFLIYVVAEILDLQRHIVLEVGDAA